jgi:CRISPR-associated endonuclease/helicase Cas3
MLLRPLVSHVKCIEPEPSAQAVWKTVRQSGRKSYLAHLGSLGENQLLSQHLLHVSAISARLGAKIGLSRVGELIGLMHDLGKYSEAFQRYLQAAAEAEGMEMEPNESVKGRVD